ncbi:response regulator, partial [Aspergillus melleus]|uniref:response regulator n=1 Tax=Aspergillus melleus TaxID=138277 RepID=UPI001E8CA625
VIDLANGILPAHESRPARIHTRQTNSLSILLAEDNEVNQKVALKFLEKHEHVVTIVENGQEALQMVQKARFDVILMDIQTPVMGGFESTTLIRQHEILHGLSRTPIIALTAHAMFGDREKCLAAGMDDYLSKPLNQNQMMQMIVKYSNSLQDASSVRG